MELEEFISLIASGIFAGISAWHGYIDEIHTADMSLIVASIFLASYLITATMYKTRR